jgi:dihydroneopterin aldolase
MITITLQNIIFHSYHGIHEEEKILGNEYEVNAVVEFPEGQNVIAHLNETIDYSRLYDIIQKRMNIPCPLLETLAMETGWAMKNEFQEIQVASITITKKNPPITGFRGDVSVTWRREF